MTKETPFLRFWRQLDHLAKLLKQPPLTLGDVTTIWQMYGCEERCK